MFELVEQQPSHLACPDVLNLSLGEPRPRPRGHLSGGAVVPPVVPRGACDAAVCLSLAPQAQRQLLLTFKICMNPRCDHWVTSVCHVGPGTLPSVPCSPWVQQPDPPFFAPRAAAWPHTRGSEWLPTGPGAPWGRSASHTGASSAPWSELQAASSPLPSALGPGPACQPTPPSGGIEQAARRKTGAR